MSTGSTSCCTTTSRRTRWVKPVVWALPVAVKSATASWHGAPCVRCLPAKEDFPYTIRVVSEITESNGSSSMATVVGRRLSMMDAGVPLKRPVAGIAMGLIKEGDALRCCPISLVTKIISATWTSKSPVRDGITSLQMDIKITSITPEIMQIALDQAKDGRIAHSG